MKWLLCKLFPRWRYEYNEAVEASSAGHMHVERNRCGERRYVWSYW